MNENNHAPLKAHTVVPHPYLALMGLYLGGFTGMYSETALNIALPQLSLAFRFDVTLTQWLVIGYMLVIGLVLPFESMIAKWFSARKVTVFALSAFLVGSLISAFAPMFPVALIGRAIQGIGTGMVLPLMFSMVLEVIPPHKIGAAMGVNALVIMSASAIGPTLAGILVGTLGWRSIFFSFVIILVVGLIFELRFGVSPYELTRPHIDPVSVVASCLGFGGIVLGAGVSSIFGWLSAPTLVSLAVGIVCLVVYAKRQLSIDVPVIDLRVFKERGFTIGALCVMLNFGITLAVMFILPQFYQNALLLDVSLAGLIMLPGGIVNAVVSALAGRLYDKIGGRIPGLCGFALSILGTVLLLFTTAESPLAYVVACHIILMVGVPLAMSPCQTHALSSLPHRLSNDGSTMLNTMQQVLGAVCTAVATYLLATGQSMYYAGGGSSSSLAFVQGSHLGFAFALVLAVVAFLLATRFKRSGAEADSAATGSHDQSAQVERVASVSGEPTVADFMKNDVYTLDENATALDALEYFAGKGISGAPVVNAEGELVGFVSDGDIISMLSHKSVAFAGLYSFAAPEHGDSFTEKLEVLETTTVGELATRAVLSVQVDSDMRDVCTLLSEHHLKKAPVMDGGRMVGIINRSDIVHHAVDMYAHVRE